MDDDQPDANDLPLTPRTRTTLRVAEELARSFGHDYVGTEHLLLALIRDSEGVAGQVLASINASEAAVQATARLMQSESYSKATDRIFR